MNDRLDPVWSEFRLIIKSLLSREDCTLGLESIFGSKLDHAALKSWFKDFSSGSPGALPAVVFLESGILPYGTGAFSIETDRIYRDESWFAQASSRARLAILVEEVGHWIDHHFNGGVDAPGDEGQRFSEWMLGLNLDDSLANQSLVSLHTGLFHE